MNDLHTLINSVLLEHQKFQTKPTKIGATRMRATLLQIKKNADALRKEILQESKEIVGKKGKKEMPESDPSAMEVPQARELPPSPPVLTRETTSTILAPPSSPVKARKTRLPKKK
jgi:hypothetical protein